MRQIRIPKLLANLHTSQEIMERRSKSPDYQPPKQPDRSKSQVMNSPTKSRLKIQQLPQSVINMGVATKLIPVDYLIRNNPDQFIQTVSQIDQVLDGIYDPNTEVINGSGFTQFVQNLQSQHVEWVDCEVLSKIDQDKFLVFIHEQNFYKIVSIGNIIFKDVVLQQEQKQYVTVGEQEQKQLPVIINLQQMLSQMNRDSSKNFLIKIFSQQRTNTDLMQKFKDAVQQFAQMAIQITKKSFESIENLAQFSVDTLQKINKADFRFNAVNQLDQMRQLQNKHFQNATTFVVERNDTNTLQLSGAMILCSQAISNIRFDKINKKSELFDFEKSKDLICADFIQHAQLTDSQLQVLQQAFMNEKHPLHWCCDFLSLFLWSSYQLFQSTNINEFCYGSQDNDVILQHKQQVEKNTLVIQQHLKSIQGKQFHYLNTYIYQVFEDHKKEVMFGANQVLLKLWSKQTPKYEQYIENSFMEVFQVGKVDQLFVKKFNTTEATFKQTFTENLINAHKLQYQIICPHFVDKIISEFADSVLNKLNKMLHEYQTVHGRTPSLQMRDELAQKAYNDVHQIYKNLFKIVEIRWFKLFIEELYEQALPEWFYFLLAMIHGGGKKKQQMPLTQNDLMKVLHLTPNVQHFSQNVEKDISSLNKFIDFKIPLDGVFERNILSTLEQIEFQVLPETTENFISGVVIHPDPMKVAQSIEECINNLAIYYSSGPKLTNSLIYNFKTGQTKSSYTVEQREQSFDFEKKDFKDFLQTIYTDTYLTETANRNPFQLDFSNEENLIEVKKMFEDKKDESKRQELKYCEVIFYELSGVIQKLQKLSNVAGEKIKNYFQIFTRYFALHIQKTQVHVQHLQQKQLLPREFEQLTGYTDIFNEIDNMAKMYKVSTEDPLLTRLKPLADFLRLKKLRELLVNLYESGEIPHKLVYEIINNQISNVLNVMKQIFENNYQIQQLPNICYYSACKINLQKLLQFLQKQDQQLFVLYTNRLQDYCQLIFDIINMYLDNITAKNSQTYFNQCKDIGSMYKAFKLLVFNKQKWLDFFELLDSKISQFENMPYGESFKAYEDLKTQLTQCRLKFKLTFQNSEKIITRVVSAYQQSLSFLQQVQAWFEQVVNDIYSRSKEYLSISQELWQICEEDPITFAKQFPQVYRNLQFPKTLRFDDSICLIDLKALSKEIELTSGMPIFRINYVKIHYFERPGQIKKAQLNDVFQELQDVITKTVQSLELVNQMYIQQLGLLETVTFDKIDTAIFQVKEKREFYVKQLLTTGEIIPMISENIDHILNNTSLQNTTQISRLQSLQQVIDTTTKLIMLCTSFNNTYKNTTDIQLAMNHPDRLKSNVVEVIQICTAMNQSFAKTVKITTISDNLMQFLVSVRHHIMIICYLKTAVYESAPQPFEGGIVSKTAVDKVLKMDPYDTAVMSQFMKQILQHSSCKIGDEVKTQEYLDQIETYYKHIFKSQLYCIKRFRFDKYQQHIQQSMSKIILSSKSMISDKYKIYKIQEQLTLENVLENSEFIVLGQQQNILQQLSDNIKLINFEDYQESSFYYRGQIDKSKLIESKFKSELIDFVEQQQQILLDSQNDQSLNQTYIQQLLAYMSSIVQMYQLCIENVDLLQQQSYINDLIRINCQGTIKFTKIENLSEIDELIRTALTNCFQTFGNALQFSQKRINKEKLWELITQQITTRNQSIQIQSVYYLHRDFQNCALPLNYLLDLIHYESISQPIIQKPGKIDYGIVLSLPEDISNTLNSLLPLLGYESCQFNALQLIIVQQSQQTTVYYIDGIKTQFGFYIKFAYPLIYNHIYEIYQNLTKEKLNEIIQLTTEQHMLYWEAQLSQFSVSTLTQIMQYPPFISYCILSQMIMKIYNELQNITCVDEILVNKCVSGLTLLLDCISEYMQQQLEDPKEVDFDSIITSIQLSVLTTVENYLFFNEQSALNPYNTTMNSKQDLSIDETTEDTQDSPNNIEEPVKNDEIINEFFDQQEKIKRPFLHDGYNATDFEYLSMVKENPKNSYEQMLILMYLQKNISSIINGVKTNSHFQQFSMIFSENNTDQLITIINSKIKSMQAKLKPKDKRKNVNNQVEQNYTPKFNNFCGGLNFQCFDFIPKIYVNADNFQYEQILNIQNISNVIIKIIQTSQLFITSPYGEITYQFMYQFISDIVGTILQTKVLILVLNSNNLQFLKQILCEKIIVLIVNHQALNEEETLQLSNIINNNNKQAKIIHLIPGLIFTFSQKTIISEEYQKIISIINGSNDSFNVVNLSQMSYMVQSQIITRKLEFQRSNLSHSVLNLIIQSQCNQDIKIKTVTCALLSQCQNVEKQKYQIVEIINDIFQKQYYIPEIEKLIIEKDVFLHIFFDIYESYKYSTEEETKVVKIGQIPPQLYSLVNIKPDLISVINEYGWKLVADIILLLIELRIDNLMLKTNLNDGILELLHVVKQIAQDSLSLQIRDIESVDDIEFTTSNQMVLQPETLYIVVYNPNYPNIFSEFLLCQKPLNCFVIIVNQECADQKIELQCQYVLPIYKAIIDVHKGAMEKIQKLSTNYINYDENKLLSQKQICATDFEYLIKHFNKDNLLKIFEQELVSLIKIQYSYTFQQISSIKVFNNREIEQISCLINQLLMQQGILINCKNQYIINDLFIRSIWCGNSKIDVIIFITIQIMLSILNSIIIFIRNQQQYVDDKVLYQNTIRFILMDTKNPEYTQQLQNWLVKNSFSVSEYLSTLQIKIAPLLQVCESGKFIQQQYFQLVNTQNQHYKTVVESQRLTLLNYQKDIRQFNIIYDAIQLNEYLIQSQVEPIEVNPQSDVFLTTEPNFEKLSSLELIKINLNERNISKQDRNQGFLLYCLLLNQFNVQMIHNSLSEQILQVVDLQIFAVNSDYHSNKNIFRQRQTQQIRKLNYVILSDEDAQLMINSLRIHAEQINNSELHFYPFTIIQIQLLDNSEKIMRIINNLLSNKMYSLNTIGLLGEFQLFNCVFLIKLKQFIKHPFLSSLFSKEQQLVIPQFKQIQNYQLQFMKFMNIQQIDSSQQNYIQQQVQSLCVNMYNKCYNNKAIFDCLKEQCKIEYLEKRIDKDNLQVIDQINKNQCMEIPINKMLLNLWNSNVLNSTVPIIIINSDIKYESLVVQLQQYYSAIVDMNQDYNKNEDENKTQFLDVGSMTSYYQTYNMQKCQANNIYYLGHKQKIVTLIRNIISNCLKLQKNLPILNDIHDQLQHQKIVSQTALHPVQNSKVICAPNLTQCQLSLSGNLINFSEIKLKTNYFQQYVLLIPVSVLLTNQLLSWFLQLTNISDNTNFLTHQELYEIQAEACAYLGIEQIPIALVKFLLAQRIQIYLINDCKHDFSNCQDFITQFNVVSNNTVSLFIYQYQMSKDSIQQCMPQYIEANCADQKFQKIIYQVSKHTQISYDLLSRISIHIYNLLIPLQQKLNNLKSFLLAIQPLDQIFQQFIDESQSFTTIVDQQNQIKYEMEQKINEMNEELQNLSNKYKQQDILQQQQQQLLNKIEIDIASEKVSHQNIMQSGIQQIEIMNRDDKEAFIVAKLNNSEILIIQLLIYIFSGEQYQNMNDLVQKLPSNSIVSEIQEKIKEKTLDKVFRNQIIEFNRQFDSNLKKLVQNVYDLVETQLTSINDRIMQKIAFYFKQLYQYCIFEPSVELAHQKRQCMIHIQEIEYTKNEGKEQIAKQKQIIQDTQKILDSHIQKISALMNQQEQKIEQIKQIKTIREQYTEYKNDLPFDIFALQKEQNLAYYTSVFLTIYLFFGYEQVESIFQKVQFEEESCMTCTYKQSLCCCVQDVDVNNQLIKKPYYANQFNYNAFFSTKEIIKQKLFNLTEQQFNNSEIVKFQFESKNDDLKELLSLMLLKGSLLDIVTCVSFRNSKLLSLLGPTQQLDCRNITLNEIITEIYKIYSFNQATSVLLILNEVSDVNLQLISIIKLINSAVLAQRQESFKFGKETFKINQSSPKIQFYILVQDLESLNSLNNLPIIITNAFKKCALMKPFDKLHFSNSEQEMQQILTQYKDIILNFSYNYLYKDKYNEQVSAVMENKAAKKQLEINQNSLINITKYINKDNLTSQLSSLQTAIELYIEAEKILNTSKTKLLKQIESRSQGIKNPQCNEFYQMYCNTAQNMVKLSNLYPELLNFIDLNMFFKQNQPLSQKQISKLPPHLQYFYTNMLNNLLDKLEFTTNYKQILEYFGIIFVVSALTMGKLTKTEQQLIQILLTKQSSTKALIKALEEQNEPLSQTAIDYLKMEQNQDIINLVININVPKNLNITQLRQVLFAFAMQVYKGGEFHQIVMDLINIVFISDFKPKIQDIPNIFKKGVTYVTKNPLKLFMWLKEQQIQASFATYNHQLAETNIICLCDKNRERKSVQLNVVNADSFDLPFQIQQLQKGQSSQQLSQLINALKQTEIFALSALQQQNFSILPSTFLQMKLDLFQTLNPQSGESVKNFLYDVQKLLEICNFQSNQFSTIQKSINQLQFIKKFTEVMRQAQQFLNFNSMYYPISDSQMTGILSFYYNNKDQKLETQFFQRNILGEIFQKLRVQFGLFDGYTVNVHSYPFLSELLETQNVSFQKEGVEFRGFNIANSEEGKFTAYLRVGSVIVEIKSYQQINGVIE